jgi:hypothetical protein
MMERAVAHMNKICLHDEASDLIYCHEPATDEWVCFPRELFLAASILKGLHAEALLWIEHPQRRRGVPPDGAAVIVFQRR